MRSARVVVTALSMLLLAGCSTADDPIRSEPAVASTSAAAATPEPPPSASPSPPPSTSIPKQLDQEDLVAVLIREGDPDFGVEWSLLGPATVPAESKSNKPDCEQFARTQYAPDGTTGLQGEEWRGDSGKQTKSLTQVATLWPAETEAKAFVDRYRYFVDTCKRYLSGGLEGDSFDTSSKPFKLRLPAGGSYAAWTTTTKLPDLPDVPDTFQSAVVVRRGNVVVLVQYNTSDTEQPAAVGREWVASYARTVDGRLATLLG